MADLETTGAAGVGVDGVGFAGSAGSVGSMVDLRTGQKIGEPRQCRCGGHGDGHAHTDGQAHEPGHGHSHGHDAETFAANATQPAGDGCGCGKH